MRKRVLGIVIAALICCLGTVSAYAMDIGMRWVNTSDVIMSLSFSNGKAKATGIISGMTDTAKITATFSLQEKNGSSWKTVHTWSSVSTTKTKLTFSGSATAKAGTAYRLYVSAKVTNTAGSQETVTKHYEKTY